MSHTTKGNTTTRACCKNATSTKKGGTIPTTVHFESRPRRQGHKTKAVSPLDLATYHKGVRVPGTAGWAHEVSATVAGTPSGHKSVKARQHARDTWRRNATTWRNSCRRCDGSVWMASRNWATISSGDKSRVPIRVSNVESGNRHGSSFISPRFKTPATVCTFCAAQRQEDGETKEWVAWYSACTTFCDCPNSSRLSTS